MNDTEIWTVCVNRGPKYEKENCLHYRHSNNPGKDLCRMRKKTRLLGKYEVRNEEKELWYIPEA